MGIIEIDHDMFANRRNRWIGRSRVVSVPSSAKQDRGHVTPTLGVVHDDEQSPFEPVASGRE